MTPIRKSRRPDGAQAPDERLVGGDAVISALLLVVGALGVVAGVAGHRPTEGTVGLLIVLLGLLSVRDARRQHSLRR